MVVTAEHREQLDQVLRLFEITPNTDLNLSQNGTDLPTLFAGASVGLAEVMKKQSPDLVLVLGDTVTTLAATLCAYYRRTPVAHVEAGLRTVDKFGTFPEQGHRLMVTSITDLHFAPTDTARQNLINEGIQPPNIYITGNTGIDALIWARDRVERLRESGQLKLKELFSKDERGRVPVSLLKGIRDVERGNRRLILISGSRPESLGTRFQSICGALSRLATSYPKHLFVYPVDLPDTMKIQISRLLHGHENIFVLPSLDYLPFIYLMELCYFVITDSGTIQEEAPSLNKPVLVMREVTDRPEAITSGTVKLVGTDAITIVTAARRLLDHTEYYRQMSEAKNPFGDGKSATRITDILTAHYNKELIV